MNPSALESSDVREGEGDFRDMARAPTLSACPSHIATQRHSTEGIVLASSSSPSSEEMIGTHIRAERSLLPLPNTLPDESRSKHKTISVCPESRRASN